MARSPLAFLRGSLSLFYDWLAQADPLPSGPAVWVCGDCHVGNVGPVGDAAERVDLQLRDIDHAVIGNPAHDLARLATSLALAARERRLGGPRIVELVEAVTAGYAQGLSHPRGRAEAPKLPEALRYVMRKALARTWKQLARERIEPDSPILPLGRHFWPLSREEQVAMRRLLAQPAVHRLVMSLRSRSETSTLELLDAAYWVKGCSSLGRLRVCALVRLRNGKKQPDHCLIDIKQALPARAPAAPDARMPQSPAQRVVEAARYLAPSLGQRMLPATLLGKDVVLRELMPQDLKLDLSSIEQREGPQVAHCLGNVLGRAHARQMTPADRQRWREQLLRGCASRGTLPAWLWSTTIGLMAAHEQAWLDHCRERLACGARS
jgi:uncharacterized protein (DUF2252 family)